MGERMNLKPNVVLPLAASYNERNVLGYSATITNRLDQRKVNSCYELIKNTITGNTTVYLVNRPGVVANSNSFGESGQVSYLAVVPPSGQSGEQPWVFSVSSNDVRVSNSTQTTTFMSAANYKPGFVDRTLVNGTDTVLVQIRSDVLTAQRAFYASSVALWTEVVSTFSTFIHRGKMEFMDGWGFILAGDNNIYNSNINTISTWPSGNFIKKQIQLDFPVGLARLNNQIIAFGQETAEVFYNAGVTPAPLGRLQHLHQRLGLSPASPANDGTHYYTTLGNRIYFVGGPGGDGSSQSAYSYDGSRFEKISNSAVDKILTERLPRSVEKINFQGKNAVAFRLENNSVTTQRWLMFFPEYNDWFEWQSNAFMPINTSFYYLGVGTNQHKVYFFDLLDNWLDANTTYTFSHQFKMPTEGNERKQMDFFGVVGDTARSTTTNTLQVAFSDDDWNTTTAAGTIDLTTPDKMITRCGAYHDRGVVLTHTGNTQVRLQSAIAKVK